VSSKPAVYQYHIYLQCPNTYRFFRKAELLREIERLKKQTAGSQVENSRFNQDNPQESRSSASIANGSHQSTSNQPQSRSSDGFLGNNMGADVDYSMQTGSIPKNMSVPMAVPTAYSSHSQSSPGQSVTESIAPFVTVNPAIALLGTLASPIQTQSSADEFRQSNVAGSQLEDTLPSPQNFTGNTSSQSLEDLKVDGSKIADCFQL
jgi:hypothetical protein